MAGPQIKAITQAQLRGNAVSALQEGVPCPNLFQLNACIAKDVYLKIIGALKENRLRSHHLQAVHPCTRYAPLGRTGLEIFRILSNEAQ